MDDYKLNIEVKVTVKPMSTKVGTAQRGPYERNMFVIQGQTTAKYVGSKTDIATFAEKAGLVATGKQLTGLKMPEVVAVNPVTNLLTTSAYVNAVGDNQGVSTAPVCLYGTTPALGSTKAAQTTPDVSANGTDTAYEFRLTGLTAGTKYYYRIRMVSSTGTAYSELKSFTTAEA
jgi:hypothetical protein